MAKLEAINIEEPQEVKRRLWTANYIMVWFSSLAVFLAFNSMVPTLPIYMETYGSISGAAGLPLAALTIGAVLSRPLAGWTLDIYGRKAIFLGGMLLFLLPLIVFIWMIPAHLLIVFRFIQGLGWGIGNTAINTVASDNVPINRMGEGMGYFTVTTSLAMAISPAVGLWVLDNYSFPILFSLISIVTFISIIPMIFIKYPIIEKKIQRPKLVFMDRSGLKPSMVMLLFCVGNSSALSFLPVYAVMQGVSATWVFFTVFPLASIIFRPVCGMLLDRRGSKGYDLVVMIGIIGQIIAMVVLARTSSVVHLIIGGCFFGLGFGWIQLSMLTYCIRAVPPEKRGAANATFWTAFDIGMAIGSIAWGLVAAAVGYFLMFNLTIIPITAAVLVYFLAGEKKKLVFPGRNN